MPDLDSRVVTSADGTAVEYLSTWRGPHVIVVPGALALACDLAALAQLAETVPRAEIMNFPDLDHFAPEKKPGKIADAVLRFFATHTQPDTEDRSTPAPSARPGL